MKEDGDRLQMMQRVVLVTGPSGAGRSTAIRALEDLSYEVIDNLPLSLIPRLLPTDIPGRPLAIGIDVRTRGFSAAALIEVLERYAADPGIELTLLYLESSDNTLERRYSETRRRHPLSPADSVSLGIAVERDILMPLRHRADILIDTSDLTPHDLKAELARWFSPDNSPGLAVSLESFSFKRGIPRSVDMMFDVRFLQNPYWEPGLRPLDGRDDAVARYVAEDPRYSTFFDKLMDIISHLLPAYKDEGKAYLCIGIGCTGGQHRSVCVTEMLGKRLEAIGWPVSIRHRELERRGAVSGREMGN